MKKEIMETIADNENMDFVWEDGTITTVTPQIFADYGKEYLDETGQDYTEEFYKYVLDLNQFHTKDGEDVE